MACDVCKPGSGPAQGVSYAQCGGATPLENDLGLIQTYAARGGARSTDFTMCQTSAFLIARRMIYWKGSPGDCGSGATYLNQSTAIETQINAKIGQIAIADPEPISKAILTGINKVVGIFTAHHAQAVKLEQDTLCAVSIQYNKAVAQIEAALSNGQIDVRTANSVLDNLVGQTQGPLTAIKKECNSACGFLIALRALQLFNEEVVFPRIAASIPALVGSTVNNALGNVPLAGIGTLNGGAGLLAVLGGVLYLGVHAL